MTLPMSKPPVGSTGWQTNYWQMVDLWNSIDERIRDLIGATVVAGVGLDMVINDAGDTITLNNTVTDTGGGEEGEGGPTVDVTQTVYKRGINMAGGEFAASASTLPGTYGTDYSYDSFAAFQAMAAKGHKIIRLPFRWERIQPSRGAALNSTELSRLTSVVSDARTAGLQVILDVHNYARYIVSGGSEQVLGDGNLTQGQLTDLWTRLSTAFKDNPGVYAYGLMNEPHDLSAVTGGFTGNNRYDWNAGTVAGWTGDSATASNVSNKLRLAATVGTGAVNFRKDDAATVAGGSGPTGNVLRFEATLVTDPGATGGWTAKAQWQNSSFAWQNPVSVAYNRVDTGASVAGLIQSVPVYVTCTFSTITSPPNAFALQIDGSGASAGSCAVDIDNFSQGSIAGSLTAAQVWENASQACVDAIRANADTKKIMVPGYGWSGAKTWATNHAAPWISDSANNFAYEAHYYFDVDNSGDYPDNYATENSAAITAGHASLSARAVSELDNFTAWCHDNNVKGFIGEVGWPNNADTSSWNAVGEAIYDLLDTAKMDATYWAAGARWGTSYNLSAYTGTNQDVSKAPSTIIEAHPTFAFEFTLANLDERYLGGGGGGGGSGADGPQGPPGLVWRGVWSGSTTYATNDAVYYQGSAFIATAGVTGTAPGAVASPNSPWQVLSGIRPGAAVALTDGATITVNSDTTDTGKVTIAGNRTMAAPTGTPYGGQRLILRIKQDATGSRTITWNSVFRFPGGTPPTLTTTASKTDYLGFIYNADDSKWDNVAFRANF